MPYNYIFKSKRPTYFYITIWLCIALVITPFILLQTKVFDTDSFVSLLILFICLIIGVYIIFGRYISVITCYNQQIKVQYLLSLKKTIHFKFEVIQTANFRDFDLLDRFSYGWHRAGKWLYLKNENDEICQFKYNIDGLDNKKLLEFIQMKCSSGVVYC